MTWTGRDDVEERAIAAFARSFGAPPEVVASAPGRVNLMGDHTDYCGGLVLPVAIEERTAVALGGSPDGRCELISLDLEGREVVEPPAMFSPRPHDGPGAWVNLAMGPLRLLAERATADIPAFRAVIASRVPIGAGVSSSAALTTAMTAAVLCRAGRLDDVPLRALVELLRDAERRFAGTPCGIMDMTVALAAEPGAALLIDCGAFTCETVPLPAELALLLVDSGVRHRLGGGAYGERRRAMEAAVRLLGSGDAPPASERGAAAGIAALAPFARHYTGENARVRAAAAALRRGDLEALGPLAFESHVSLRDELRVSTPELDRIVDLVRDRGVRGGAIGARLTGGGFGGSVVVFADRRRLSELRPLLDDAVDAGHAAGYREVRPGHRYTARRQGGAP